MLILDGQLFEGGWQHRMATRSYLIPAGTEQALDVACVERDRWGGGAEQWSDGRRSPVSIRMGAEQGGQEEVWRRIYMRSPRSDTGSLLGAMQVADEQASLLLRYVRPLVGQVGLLVGIGGAPVTLEVFDDPRTLQEQTRHIVRAASLDALGSPALPTPDGLARQALASVERCSLDMEPRVGQAGRLSRGASQGFDVMALNYKLTCLHLRASNTRHPVLQAA